MVDDQNQLHTKEMPKMGSPNKIKPLTPDSSGFNPDSVTGRFPTKFPKPD